MTKLALYIEFEVGKVDPHPQREEGLTNYEVLTWLQGTMIPEFKRHFGYEVGFNTVCGADAGKSDLDYLRMADWVKEKRRQYRKAKRERAALPPRSSP